MSIKIVNFFLKYYKQLYFSDFPLFLAVPFQEGVLNFLSSLSENVQLSLRINVSVQVLLCHQEVFHLFLNELIVAHSIVLETLLIQRVD